MENQDMIDHQHKASSPLWTIRLLITSVIITALTFLLATFWLELGFNRADTIWLALSLMISFGINIAGLIFGAIERKYNKKKALIGIIGNALLIVLFLLIVVYSIFAVVEGTIPR